MGLDILFTGGTLVDGTGASARPADVGVRAGLVEYVGAPRPDLRATEVIDCTGLVLAPGFIDIHTHSDLTVLAAPAVESAVLQGVTTQVVGNCGFSTFPGRPARRSLLEDHVGGVGGEQVPINWDDLDGYEGALRDSPPAINIVALVGHGALRIAAMDDPYAAATDRDLRRMRELLGECLDQGAAGLSTGLTYQPSLQASAAEIHALARECAIRGRIYATHARVTAGNENGAIDEAIEVSRATGVRLEFSHLALNDPASWGRATESLGRFEAAAAQGLLVGFDVYPYDASSSPAIQYLPDWVQRGGSTALARNAADRKWESAAVAAISRGFYGGIPWHWDRIVLSAAPGRDEIVGRSIAEVAELWRADPAQVLLDICVDLGSSAQVVLHYRTEQDMCAFLAHSLSVLGSDGLARPLAGPDHPHPRSFGAYPRVLGRYVRDLALLNLPDAIRKMTGEPARRLGLIGRGTVQQGSAADLVIFDPAAVNDRASFAEPRLPPSGVHRTVVAGTTVALDGSVLAARPGRLVRCGM